MEYVNRFVSKFSSLFFGYRPDDICVPPLDAVSRKRPRDDLAEDPIVIEDSPPKRTRTLGSVLREANMNKMNTTLSTSGTQTYGNLLLPSRPKLPGSDSHKTFDGWTPVVDNDDDTLSPTKFKNRYKAPKHLRSPNKRSRPNITSRSASNGMISIDLTAPTTSRSKSNMVSSRGLFGTPRSSPKSQMFRHIIDPSSRDDYQRLLFTVLSDSTKEALKEPSVPRFSGTVVDLTESVARFMKRFSKEDPVIDLTSPPTSPVGRKNSTTLVAQPLIGQKSQRTPVVQPNIINIEDENEFPRSHRELLSTPRRIVPRQNSFEEKIRNNKVTDETLTTRNHSNYENFIQKAVALGEQFHAQSLCNSRISNTAIDDLISSRLHDHLRITEAIAEEEKEEEIQTVKAELDQEMLAKVHNAWNQRMPASEVMVSKFKLDITRGDLLTLKNLNWLNDSVINYYMELIAERGGSAPAYPKVHVFSTFFYPSLGSRGYSGVKRYTKKVDIFSKDLIFVPIHLSVHWCMARIDLKLKKIFYYDSMRANNQAALNILLDYLVQEHKDKQSTTELDASEWELINDKDIPCQRNGSDCGVFACTFAEYSSRRSKFNFSQDDMPYMRQKMVYEILQGRLLL